MEMSLWALREPLGRGKGRKGREGYVEEPGKPPL